MVVDDTKELLEDINTEITDWEWGETDTLLMRARDWIERWALVEVAARKVETIGDIIKRTGRAPVHELYYAQAELDRAIAAALGEDKA